MADERLSIAQTVRVCPTHGLALFNLPIVRAEPTRVPWEFRAEGRVSMNPWHCSHCGCVVDELPLFARPCPGDGLTTDPAARADRMADAGTRERSGPMAR